MASDGRRHGWDPAVPVDPVASHALLDLATTAAGIGTFDWDLHSGTLGWDDALLELFGYRGAEFDHTTGPNRIPPGVPDSPPLVPQPE